MSAGTFKATMAMAELGRMPVTSDWVFFPSDRKSGHIDSVAKALERLRELMAVADFKGHDLRRTVHTLMGKLKIRKFDRALVLNHVRRQDGATRADDVSDQYEYDDEESSALEKWDAYLGGLVAGAGPGEGSTLGEAGAAATP